VASSALTDFSFISGATLIVKAADILHVNNSVTNYTIS